MLYFFNGLPRLVFCVAPLSFLFFDLRILGAAPLLMLAHALPHLAHGLYTNSRLQGRFRASLWSEVYEVVLASYIVIPTTLALIAPRLGKFNVTAKGGIVPRRYFDGRIAVPYLILAGLNLAGIAVGASRAYLGDPNLDVVAFNMVWASYNFAILAAASAVAWESRQLRENPRIETRLPVLLRHRGHVFETETRDLSLGGAGLTCPEGLEVQVGDPVRLAIEVDGRPAPAHGRVANRSGERLGIAFENLDLREEEGVVRAAFSRASSWTRWSPDRRPDRPLWSLGQILGHALGATALLLTSPLRRMKAPEVAS
jgi:cellulose synthase (UDP-forming)